MYLYSRRQINPVNRKEDRGRDRYWQHSCIYDSVEELSFRGRTRSRCVNVPDGVINGLKRVTAVLDLANKISGVCEGV